MRRKKNGYSVVLFLLVCLFFISFTSATFSTNALVIGGTNGTAGFPSAHEQTVRSYFLATAPGGWEADYCLTAVTTCVDTAIAAGNYSIIMRSYTGVYLHKSSWNKAAENGILAVHAHGSNSFAELTTPPWFFSAMTVSGGITNVTRSYGNGLEVFDATSANSTEESWATPVVAGKAAQIMSNYSNYTIWDVRQHLRQISSFYNGTNGSGNWTKEQGYGRPDLTNNVAVLELAPPLQANYSVDKANGQINFSWSRFQQTNTSGVRIYQDNDSTMLYEGNDTYYLWNYGPVQNATVYLRSYSNITSQESRDESFTTIQFNVTPPSFSNATYNSTLANKTTQFSIKWDDDLALHPDGQWIFSTNNSGTWVNDSAVNFTTTPLSVSVTKTLNATVGTIIGYRWYASDNFQNINHTSILTLVTTEPYEVSSCSELQNISNDLTGYYELAGDINCSDTVSWNSGTGFIPIGNGSGNFTGVLEGKNFTITNLFINRPGSDYQGLFQDIESNATIRNVTLENVSITAHNYIGGLVARNKGNISGSFVSGVIDGNSFLGGLVAYNNPGVITTSFSSINLTGASGTIGGLVGQNIGEISVSYSTGNVTGDFFVGGLVGYSQSAIANVYSTANVTGTDYVGGLIGYQTSSINNAYAAGVLSGSTFVGGLVGDGTGSATNTFWDVNVTGQPTSDGGTGKNTTQLKNSSLFSDNGWNITTIPASNAIWFIDDGDHYPQFSWEFDDDSLDPSLNVARTSATQTTITVSFNCTDASGTYYCNLSSSSGSLSVSNSDGSATTSVLSGASCGTSYTFTVLSQDNAANSANTSQSFSTSACSTVPSSSSSGGGSSSASSENIENEKLQEGLSTDFSVGDTKQISIKGSGHSITVNAFSPESVQVTIQSDPIVVFLYPNIEKNIDLDNDGFYDLLLKYLGLDNGKAKLFLKEIAPLTLNVSNQTNDSGSDKAVTGGESEMKNVSVLILFLGALIVGLLVIFLVIWFYRRKLF